MTTLTSIIENDARVAYAKLRVLMQDATPPDAKLAEITAQAKLIKTFNWNNQNPSDVERYAEMAFAEGHVELFEKVCDWCRVFSVKETSELGPWSKCLYLLYLSINCRSANSVKLANRLARSKHYIRMEELNIRSNINNEIVLSIYLRNDLNHLTMVPESIEYFRRLYPQILEVYNTQK